MISSHGFPFVSQVSSLDRKLCFAEWGLRGGRTREKQCEGPPSPVDVGRWRRGGVGAGLLAGGGAPGLKGWGSQRGGWTPGSGRGLQPHNSPGASAAT